MGIAKFYFVILRNGFAFYGNAIHKSHVVFIKIFDLPFATTSWLQTDMMTTYIHWDTSCLTKDFFLTIFDNVQLTGLLISSYNNFHSVLNLCLNNEFLDGL